MNKIKESQSTSSQEGINEFVQELEQKLFDKSVELN